MSTGGGCPLGFTLRERRAITLSSLYGGSPEAWKRYVMQDSQKAENHRTANNLSPSSLGDPYGDGCDDSLSKVPQSRRPNRPPPALPPQRQPFSARGWLYWVQVVGLHTFGLLVVFFVGMVCVHGLRDHLRRDGNERGSGPFRMFCVLFVIPFRLAGQMLVLLAADADALFPRRHFESRADVTDATIHSQPPFPSSDTSSILASEEFHSATSTSDEVIEAAESALSHASQIILVVAETEATPVSRDTEL